MNIDCRSEIFNAVYFETKIILNKKIAPSVFEIKIYAPDFFSNLFCLKAGQFINFYVGDKAMLLPRPISICEINRESFEIRVVYRVAGLGTEIMSKLKNNDKLFVMGPLGNGFCYLKNKRVWIVGGGIGTPPLLQLAKEINNSCVTEIFLGFRGGTDNPPILTDDFKKICGNVFVATEDGSVGTKGYVSDVFADRKKPDHVYACGPMPMLSAVTEWAKSNGVSVSVSVEERMACGYGACVGCAVRIKDGNTFAYKKVCRDGPVFNGEHIFF
ncbi:MAG: dihydroorotate dehydrogenase electron transfer subunit [Defluviitaleaceae bacterium]|nr:dihydroorotate dehydrogenase electron transfer subunit [Defluviitaleaceae bacterium]